MRLRTALTALALAATLTACGSDGDSTPDKPAPEATAPSDDTAGGDMPEGPADPLNLGTTADTAGTDGASPLAITPDTVIYNDTATGETPDGDTYALLAYKAKPGEVATGEAPPITGGGWTYIAPDGEALGWDHGNTTNVVPDNYGSGGDIQAGTFEWRVAVFDLTEDQLGGQAQYVDGAGVAHRWTLPDTDTGPQIDKLKQSIA